MKENYLDDYSQNKNRYLLSNPLYRIKYTHLAAIFILIVNALVFSENIIAIFVQLILAIVIFFHDMDDKYLKTALSQKIKDLKHHEETLKKKVEKEVQKNEASNKKIIDQLMASKRVEHDLSAQKYALDEHAIVATTDIDGNITYVNDKFTDISGYTKEELIGKNHRLLNSGIHDKAFWQEMYHDITSKKTWHKEVCNRAKDGSLYWVDTTVVAMFDDKGKVKSFIGIRADISQKKKDEIALIQAKVEAENSAVAKSEFLASMSHEIRTPLNAILGFVTILKKTEQEEKSRGYLDIIDSSGKSLLTIINDILDFSKMQSGKFDIEKQPIVPLEEFSNTIMLFSSNSYAKQHTYTVYIDPKLPRSLNLDIVRINQILSNLLSNAIKFTPMYGAVNVGITYVENKLVISVKDSGIGIAEENIDKIFSAFSQADGSTTRKYGGTGLGLSISSILAELMDGTLTVKSEEKKGSTFTLSLPVEVIDIEPLVLVNKNHLATVKIAILNNTQEHKSSVELMKQYLEDFGVKSVLSLETYQENGYDVLFFVPDDEYNEEIVESDTPSIALFRDDTVDIKHLEHIVPLRAPFIPKSIIESLNRVCSQDIKGALKEQEKSPEDEEIQFQGNILIAEDNVTNQMLIKLLLMDYGLSFKIANDGIEAVEMFKKGKFNMVLMDENMPNQNGIEAMLEIKAYEKEKKLPSTPVIALTANALESDKQRFKEVGMDGFVAKPIETKSLEIELSKYLQLV